MDQPSQKTNDQEYQLAIAEMRESIADEDSGRLRPVSVVAEEIQKKYGFARLSLPSEDCEKTEA